MRILIIIVAALSLVATQADARHRRYGGYRFFESPRFERGVIERGLVERSYGRRSGRETQGYERTRSKIAALIPRDWRQEEPDPKQSGSRFVSAAGDAWIAFYATLADREGVDQHWKVVAYADGEELTYLQREPSWVAVSGFKGERVFYRKAVLACGGRQWRHVALEHPALAKRDFDPLVTRMARALDGEIEENCDNTVGRAAEPAQ